LIAAIIKEVASGDVVDSNYPYNGNGSANSLDPGDYAVELYYSYALQFGGQLFNNSLTGNTDCWVYMDTITVPPFSANSFQSVTTITCSGITYVNLVVDSNSGVPPYLYEVIAGPQTFPPQASNLFTIDDPGIYLFRITDSCNNTFIQQVTVTTDSFPNIIKQGSSCVGSAINLIAIASPYFSYEWLSPNGSIYYGNIFSINPLTIADTGTYLITKYVSINGCVDTFYSSYVVNLNNTYEINATICTGQSYTIGTNSYNLTGQYVDTLSAAVGCDSIIYLNLTVTDFKRDSMELTICSGESITLGGATYTQAGIYVDTIPTTTCDSIFKLTLYLLDYKRDTINAQLCEGESYSMGGNSFAVSGTYIDTLSTSTCDSIITLNLSITDFIRDTIDIAICQGNTYLFNNTALSAAGTFNDTLSTSTCDSIITLNLSITDYLRDTIDIAICQGNTYQLGQNTLTLAGLYTDTLSGSTCDSIIILTLSVTPPPQQSVQYTICANESVIVGNNTYTQPGFYSDTLVTGNCDSILLIAIDVLPFGFDTIYPVICQDELYTLGNTSYNTSGVYTDTVSTSGCDSILTVFLTVNSSPNVNITASDSVVYPNDIVRLNSSAYNVSYQWNSIAELSDPFIKNPSATMTESAWIYITIENDYGCTAEDSIYVRVIQVDCDERKLFVPNSFSPNGDGVNDKFFAIANQVEFIEMQIFNRWGQLVFQSNDINSKWDGRFKDTIELGLYVYWIRYAGCEEELTKGTILLLE
jgi:gliding motility-associated-like protein